MNCQSTSCGKYSQDNGHQFHHLGMEGGEGRIEGGEPALPPTGEFHQPSVGDLPVALNQTAIDLNIRKVVRPEFMRRKVPDLPEFFPCTQGRLIAFELHVEP